MTTCTFSFFCTRKIHHHSSSKSAKNSIVQIIWLPIKLSLWASEKYELTYPVCGPNNDYPSIFVFLSRLKTIHRLDIMFKIIKKMNFLWHYRVLACKNSLSYTEDIIKPLADQLVAVRDAYDVPEVLGVVIAPS